MLSTRSAQVCIPLCGDCRIVLFRSPHLTFVRVFCEPPEPLRGPLQPFNPISSSLQSELPPNIYLEHSLESNWRKSHANVPIRFFRRESHLALSRGVWEEHANCKISTGTAVNTRLHSFLVMVSVPKSLNRSRQSSRPTMSQLSGSRSTFQAWRLAISIRKSCFANPLPL